MSIIKIPLTEPIKISKLVGNTGPFNCEKESKYNPKLGNIEKSTSTIKHIDNSKI